MPHSYRDVFAVHLKYIDYVRSKSLLVHQYFHNIGTTGSSVEVELRELLRRLLPARFRVTHGYVVDAPSRTEEPHVSSQVDILIVDTLVPHSLFVIDDSQGMELVPRESVVGIIEAKRTLTNATVREASAHLAEIVSTAGVTKDDDTRLLPGGTPLGELLVGGYRCNPLVGILAIDAADVYTTTPGTLSAEVLELNGDEFGLDFVGALSGIMVATALGPSGDLSVFNPRPAGPMNWGEVSPAVMDPPVALSRLFGFILAYIGTCSGRAVPVDRYFFNTSIVDVGVTTGGDAAT
jgi:hypothetical protein